jgi:hypothetical protein
MDENLGADLELSNAVVNHLHSSLQGQFASLNMLSQLGYSGFNPDSVSICQSNITYTQRLLENISQGIPVLSRIWKSPQTQDAKEVMILLEICKKELISYADQIEAILIEPKLSEDQEQTKTLIGAYARFAYSNENYIKGYIQYCEHFTLIDQKASYDQLLPQAEKNIEAAHMFFDLYTDEKEVPPIFYRSLFEEGLFLPGVFRTTIHDFNRFLATYRGKFDFNDAGISQEIAQEWSVINIPAFTAGYWNAFTLTAQDFIAWMQVGINSPRAAWFWKCLQFESVEAAPWIRFGFQPPLAREWADRKYSAEEAVELINQGFTNPDTAREESRRIPEETTEGES